MDLDYVDEMRQEAKQVYDKYNVKLPFYCEVATYKMSNPT